MVTSVESNSVRFLCPQLFSATCVNTIMHFEVNVGGMCHAEE